MTALEKAISNNLAEITAAYSRADHIKAPMPSIDEALAPSSVGSIFGDRGDNVGPYYRHFRGWAYSAINALASEAASQPVLAGRKYSDGGTMQRGTLAGRKSGVDTYRSWHSMPPRIKSHFGQVGEVEVIPNHPALSLLETPNPIQKRWQFVYNFVANLCLTGWGYIIGGETEDGLQLYSVPTLWITPSHKNGPFSEFMLKNPKNPTAPPVPIPRENVAFSHLPNPMDPLSATSPIGSQLQAVRVDDHIQTSQERFFENGIFPSMLVEMGKDPHPEVAGGLRPRLSPEQRRQVTGAIRKVLGGVANMGAPAIVDGLIENIRPLSFSQREMGWEKSEDKVRVRILSAFGVHPYILGEPINIGGYAQAAKIEERFCRRVNVLLDMLSAVVSSFVVPMTQEESVVVWWEETAPHDPQIHWQNIRKGRELGDITRDEYRAMCKLSDALPEEDEHRARLLDTSGGANFILQVMDRVGSGSISPEAAALSLSVVMEIPLEEARLMVGNPMESNDNGAQESEAVVSE